MEIGSFVVRLDDNSVKPKGRDVLIVTLKVDESGILTCSAVDKRTQKSNKLELSW